MPDKVQTDIAAETVPAAPPACSDAFAWCRDVTRHHAKTFYLATRFLPKSQRNPIYAMYALLRTVDDLVDTAEEDIALGKLDRKGLARQMEEWREKLRACYDGRPGNDPIMIAWHETLKSCDIPIELPLDLMDGVAMDIDFKPFETFDELYVYCYKVASVVGLMCSEIFGYSDRKALDHAIELGIAMQLTNILRDVGEDVDRNRIYIPLEEVRRFGCSEEQFMQKRIDENFRNLIRFQIDRARNYYRASDQGIPMLEKRSRFAVRLSSLNYNNILRTIEENSYDVFSRRAYRSFYQKLRTIPTIWLKTYLSN